MDDNLYPLSTEAGEPPPAVFDTNTGEIAIQIASTYIQPGVLRVALAASIKRALDREREAAIYYAGQIGRWHAAGRLKLHDGRANRALRQKKEEK